MAKRFCKYVAKKWNGTGPKLCNSAKVVMMVLCLGDGEWGKQGNLTAVLLRLFYD